MCGDCTERMVLNVIDSYRITMSEDESINLIDLRHFWQETPDFFDAFSKKRSLPVTELKSLLSVAGASSTNDKYPFLAISLCHLIERSLFDSFNENHISTIRNIFGVETLSGYFNTRKERAEDTIWASFWEADTFSSGESWEEFTKKITGNLREAEILLEEYLRRCTAEPNDPAEKEFSSSDWSFLSNSLPAIYYSLCIFARNDPQHTILRRLALARPGICDFAGDAYWLARKAFWFCLQERGMSFMTQNFSNLRYVLIAYAVLKKPIPVAELHALRIQVQSQENFQTEQIEQRDLLEIIDSKLPL